MPVTSIKCPHCGVIGKVKTLRGRLTPDERKLHAESPGPIDVVRTLEQALQAMGLEWEE